MRRALQTPVAVAGGAGLGASLALIHIYVAPIKRFLQALWALGFSGGLFLVATQARSATCHGSGWPKRADLASSSPRATAGTRKPLSHFVRAVRPLRRALQAAVLTCMPGGACCGSPQLTQQPWLSRASLVCRRSRCPSTWRPTRAPCGWWGPSSPRSPALRSRRACAPLPRQAAPPYLLRAASETPQPAMGRSWERVWHDCAPPRLRQAHVCGSRVSLRP